MQIGDYVQERKTGARGEVVQKFEDGWLMVDFHHPTRTFGERHSEQLITIVKGDR